MLARLETRGVAIGARAAARVRDRLAAAIDLAGIDVQVTDAGVTLAGRGLIARARRDPRLRWLGRLAR